ncbi:PAS domain S-box protein [Desulfomonile tiedjei]|nr:PAS domain S-box protein [Desulfomonile tiedjei]
MNEPSEDLLSAISQDHMYVLTRNGTFFNVSPSALETIGLKEEEVIGKNWREIEFHENLLPLFEKNLEKTFRTNRTCCGELTMPTAAGVRSYEYTLSPIRLKHDPDCVLVILRDVTETAETISDLQWNDEPGQRPVQSLNSIVLRLHVDGTIMFLNNFGLNFFGYAKHEILGKNVAILLPEKDRFGLVLSSLPDEVLKNPQSYKHVENENIRKDGSRAWVSWTNTALFDERGQIKEIVCIGNDITRVKELEERLTRSNEELEQRVIERTAELERTNRQLKLEIAGRRAIQKSLEDSEERFRLIAEKVDDVFWIVDPHDAKVLYVSPAYEKVWGRSREGLYTSRGDFPQNVHPDDRSRVFEATQELLLEGSFCCDYRIIRPDGTIRWIEDRSFPVRDSDKILKYVAGVARDITERRLAEIRLRESEELFRRTFDKAPIGAALVSMDLRVLRVNEALCKMTQYSEREFAKLGMCGVAHPGEVEPDLERIKQLERGVIESYSADKRYFRKDGKMIWVDSSVRLIRDYMGNPLYYLPMMTEITDRKIAEFQLSESEERFRLAAQFASDFVYEWNLKTDSVRTFGTGAPPLGYSDEEFENITQWISKIHPDDIDRVRDGVRNSIEAGTPYSEEYRVVHKDGSYRYWWGRGNALRDEEGTAYKWIGAASDVTDRKITELRLQRLNRALRMVNACNELLVRASSESSLLEGICDVIVNTGGYHMAWIGFALDIEGKEVRPVAWSGSESEHLQSVHVSWDPSRPDGQGPIAQAIRSGEYCVVTDIQSDPGTQCWNDLPFFQKCKSVACLPLFVHKKIIGILTIYSDREEAYDAEEISLLMSLSEDLSYGLTTLRLRAAHENMAKVLEQREKQYRLLTDNSLTGIFIFQNERLVYVNDRLASTYGYSREEVLGREPRQFLVEEDREWAMAQKNSLFQGAELEPAEIRVYDKAGNVRWVQVYVSSIEHNSEPAIMGNIVDITDRKKAEQNLQETLSRLEMVNQELEQFTYVSYHDLKEPLRNIITCLQMIEKHDRDRVSEDGKMLMIHAVEGAHRLVRLIDSLLDYTKIRSSEREDVVISSESSLTTAIENLDTVIRESGARITYTPLPDVKADPVLLTQVFQNLLSNAIKFQCEERSKIHVSALRQGSEYVFAVQDNGIGIDPQYFERIFVIFQRLFSADEYPGTGTGLAIVKKIVESHGGTVWVESELGKGSTFLFSLPAPRSA